MSAFFAKLLFGKTINRMMADAWDKGYTTGGWAALNPEWFKPVTNPYRD